MNKLTLKNSPAYDVAIQNGLVVAMNTPLKTIRFANTAVNSNGPTARC